ncbi:hypothetical protein E1301_Tti022284 [Triplophysa tibetana]|uniref:Uncharacterized protein n=1 Tax=Triplophysa tibetana TaxID=1572043 RepID=A0A5A9N671_9TELE|nr:hypothetical protein E1301_Tti022284 [Triplophysa tibetana]
MQSAFHTGTPVENVAVISSPPEVERENSPRQVVICNGFKFTILPSFLIVSSLSTGKRAISIQIITTTNGSSLHPRPHSRILRSGSFKLARSLYSHNRRRASTVSSASILRNLSHAALTIYISAAVARHPEQ